VTDPLLDVRDLDVLYGPSQALFGVSVAVEPGTVVAVLGANGAGKSTLARAASGLVPRSAGSVRFDGHDITRLSPHRIRKLGLTYIPEGRGIFPGLSVLDNLRMAVAQERRQDRARAIDRAIERFPVLGTRRAQRAGSLSGGEQQMLALGRAMMAKPRVLLLDEPSLGLAPVMTDVTFEKIGEIHKLGTAILLVEQNVSRALSLVTRAYVLESGNVIMHGSSEELANNKQVQAAYLGI